MTRVVLGGVTAATALIGCMANLNQVNAAKTPGSHRPAGHERPQASTAPRSTKPTATAAATARPLDGKTVGIDPGHNGRSYTNPRYLNHRIWNGREYEPCNQTGTTTNGGYTEARFTWHVATDLRKELRAEGARVVMTRHNNHGVGPCVTRRARIINQAHSDVGIDIHGDGGPSSGRGFAVLEPVRDKENRHVLGRSARFGRILRHQLLTRTPLPTSSYDGRRGISHRNDLAGLNLTKVPLVLIECGNMRNPTDAHLMSSRHFQHRLAHVFAIAITKFALRHQ